MSAVLEDRKGNQALFRSLEEDPDSEWQEWFLTRKEGCCFVESLRGYTKFVLEDAQARASAAREKRRRNPDFTFPGYNNKKSLQEIFTDLCDIDKFDDRRLMIATAHR